MIKNHNKKFRLQSKYTQKLINIKAKQYVRHETGFQYYKTELITTIELMARFYFYNTDFE